MKEAFPQNKPERRRKKKPEGAQWTHAQKCGCPQQTSLEIYDGATWELTGRKEATYDIIAYGVHIIATGLFENDEGRIRWLMISTSPLLIWERSLVNTYSDKDEHAGFISSVKRGVYSSRRVVLS